MSDPRSDTLNRSLRSTRPKDLVDILLIARSTTIQAEDLRHALQATFVERDRQPLPTSLPPPPTTWIDPYRRLASTVNVEADLASAYTRAAIFLDPVLAGQEHGTRVAGNGCPQVSDLNTAVPPPPSQLHLRQSGTGFREHT